MQEHIKAMTETSVAEENSVVHASQSTRLIQHVGYRPGGECGRARNGSCDRAFAARESETEGSSEGSENAIAVKQ